MELLLKLIGMSVVATMLAWWFTPLNTLKTWVWSKLNYPSWMEPMFCSKCVGFWFGLAMTFNLWHAGVVCIMSYLLYVLIERIEDNGE